MPILEVEMVSDVQPPAGLPCRIADAAAQALGTAPERTWVRLRTLPRAQYGEGGGALPETVKPVFVSVLEASVAAPPVLQARVAALTSAIAGACDRPSENVHVLYLPPAAGRMAFGGQLVV